MRTAWKYEIIRTGNYMVPIIHASAFTHLDVVQRLMDIVPRHGGPLEVIAAGFVEGLNVVHAGGLSESLRVGSSEHDAPILNMYERSRGVWPPGGR